jgi:hypothetical protein
MQSTRGNTANPIPQTVNINYANPQMLAPYNSTDANGLPWLNMMLHLSGQKFNSLGLVTYLYSTINC